MIYIIFFIIYVFIGILMEMVLKITEPSIYGVVFFWMGIILGDIISRESK